MTIKAIFVNGKNDVEKKNKTGKFSFIKVIQLRKTKDNLPFSEERMFFLNEPLTDLETYRFGDVLDLEVEISESLNAAPLFKSCSLITPSPYYVDDKYILDTIENVL